MSEQNRYKKRKKWMENLSVLSLDEDEPSCTATINEGEKQSIIDTKKANHQRFPYFMCSDDSDDEDGIKYFPSDSLCKSEIKKTVSSSNKQRAKSVGNNSYKHTKRKENSKHSKKYVHKDFTGDSSAKNDSVRRKSKSYIPQNGKKTSMSQRNAKTSTSGSYDGLINKKYINVEHNYVPPHNKHVNRFLDSSSETSNQEIINKKTKRSKLRRVRVFATSSSSSESEEDLKKTVQPKNPKLSEITALDNDKSEASCKAKTRVIPCLSTEDENDSDLSLEPQNKAITRNVHFNPEDHKQNAQIKNTKSGYPEPSMHNYCPKPVKNAHAWRSIAISDIKAQFNKPSKVNELRRKLVEPNASSVAIHKEIHKREMLKTYSRVVRPSIRPPCNSKGPLSQKLEQRLCESKYNNILDTSVTRQQEQALNALSGNQIKENNDSVKISSADFFVPDRRVTLTENANEYPEKLNLHESHLQSTSHPSMIDRDIKTVGKNIRQPHKKELKNQSKNGLPSKLNPGIKITNTYSKKTQSFSEKTKESKQTLDDTSAACDVLGNIMSQMDSNPYKVKKPTNKKPVGWFPAGSNASPLFGHIQSASGLPANVYEFQSRNHLPIGAIPTAVTKTTATTNSNINPSYNPLSPAVMINNAKQIDVGIEKKTNIEHRNREISNSKHFSQVDNKLNTSSSNTVTNSSNGEGFVPFYSAPQEDYTDKNYRLKSEMEHNEILSRFTAHFPNISLIREPSAESLNNQLINQEQRPSKDSHKIVRGESANGEECVRIGPLQTCFPSGFRKGSGAIRNELKENNKIINNEKGIRIRIRGTEFRLPSKHTATLPTKKSEADVKVSDVNHHEVNLEQSSYGVALSTALSNENEMHKDLLQNVVTESKEVTVPTVSGSSTSSSSTDNSSSSSDDSSDTSDDSGKSSSAESSMPDDKVSTAESPIIKDTINNFDNLNISCNTENHIAPVGTVEQTEVAPSNEIGLAPLPAQDFLGCGRSETKKLSLSHNVSNKTSKCKDFKKHPVSQISNAKSNKEQLIKSFNVDEVIILSGSSDSDSNDQLQDKEFTSQNLHRVGKNTELSGPDRVDSLVESSNLTTQTKQNHLNANKVGKIRVRSLTELGVNNKSVIENALQSTQVQEVSETQRSRLPENSLSSFVEKTIKEMLKEPEKTSTDVQVSQEIHEKATSWVNWLGKKITESTDLQTHLKIPGNPTPNKNQFVNKPTTSISMQVPKQIPENPTNRENQFVKKPTNGVAPIVLPMAIIRPVNTVGPVKAYLIPATSRLNQENNVGNRLVTGSGSSTLVEPMYSQSLQNVPAQATTSIFLNSWNPEISQNSARVVSMPYPTQEVENCTSRLNQENNVGNRLVTGSGSSTLVEPMYSQSLQNIPVQATTSIFLNSWNPEISQNSARVVSMPYPAQEVENLFFKLCDELFSDVVLFKIPKLADDLHLLINFDNMKEERLKKLDQLLLLPETIMSEKLRIEKETADIIKIRSQSFVPLFLTITNRIDRDNIKALITAVYCRIVHQLERIDPVNANYRYKIRSIMKNMLQKHSLSVQKEVLTYFETENDSIFLTNFGYIEELLRKYDLYFENRQNNTPQNNDIVSNPAQERLESNNLSERPYEVANSAHSCQVNVSGITPSTPAKPQPPLVGNLDEVFLMKCLKK